MEVTNRMIKERFGDEVGATLERARKLLMAERKFPGVWRGGLSSSALSTATAILALNSVDRERHAQAIQRAIKWLESTQWASGGWGDTEHSLPNLSTTLLCWSALGTSLHEGTESVSGCERWLLSEAGGLAPAQILEALRRRYGKDQTFSVPIIMACALGGRLGTSPDCWRLVPQLPFQLAALPREWFARLHLPVVSYALPALIAIGQARHFHAPSGVGRLGRRWSRERTLRVLEEIQPSGGGFLEATPLTSFVAMALGSMQFQEHPVARKSVEFLVSSQRADGSWPIDTDLATWVTTLSVKALGAEFDGPEETCAWLLAQQHRQVHPYTQSAPGGWAWTDLSGGVPDADDTAGALLALGEVGSAHQDTERAVRMGVKWLIDLQNRDGGMPTFCRGWGALPFDRSTPEITAHVLAAWHRWNAVDIRIPWARHLALDYINKVQSPHGWWEPLWFGNQWAVGESNRVYGTASIIRDLSPLHGVLGMDAAVRWMLRVQRAEGGWGGGKLGPDSIEETALGVLALARYMACGRGIKQREALCKALARGVERLLVLTEHGTKFSPSPIGLYFARLWYSERLYPVIWTVAALREARGLVS